MTDSLSDALPSDLRAWVEAMQTDTMANMTLVDIAAVNDECPSEDMGKAADEIERLRAENERLRATLEQFSKCELNDGNCASLEVATKRIRGIARAALERT